MRFIAGPLLCAIKSVFGTQEAVLYIAIINALFFFNGFFCMVNKAPSSETFFDKIFMSKYSLENRNYMEFTQFVRPEKTNSSLVIFSGLRLHRHLFPCNTIEGHNLQLRHDWHSLQADILVPCTEANINLSMEMINGAEHVLLEDVPMSVKSGQCVQIPGIEAPLQRSFMVFPMKETLLEDLKNEPAKTVQLNLATSLRNFFHGHFSDIQDPFVRFAIKTQLCQITCSNSSNDVIYRNFDCMAGEQAHFAYFNASAIREEPAMLISPYFQHTAIDCQVRFKYRIMGKRGSAIIVTTQHRAIEADDDDVDVDHRKETSSSLVPQEHGEYFDDDDDWTRPTEHGKFASEHDYISSWKLATVHIGHFQYPTRIRIECHVAEKIEPVQLQKATFNGHITECYVDDIELKSCEAEYWYENQCDSAAKRKYTCQRFGIRKCIDFDQLCDLTVDCPGGEDEDDRLHNCSSMPTGARCTFEENNAECGWSMETREHRSGEVSDRHLLHIVQASAVKRNFTSLPVQDHTFMRANDSGHYILFADFTINDSEKPSAGRSGAVVRQTFLRTPYFPPTNPAVYDSSSPIYDTCKVRFYYCRHGSSINNALISVKSILEHIPSKIIWEESKELDSSGATFCDWNRISFDLPKQDNDFYLQFTVSNLFTDPLAIDDFSISPSCFREIDPNQPDNITSCGKTGAIPSTAAECKSYNERKSAKSGMIYQWDDNHGDADGMRHWRAGMTAEYLIEAYGAAGGWLPQSTVNNFGGKTMAALNLSDGEMLAVAVGQMGETPCRGYGNRKPMNKKAIEVLKAACDPLNSAMSADAAKAVSVKFPGTGGGGATVVIRKGEAILIAGGGGGLFPNLAIVMDQSNYRSEGGIAHVDGIKFNALTGTGHDDSWMSGNGSNFSEPFNLKQLTCPNCSALMNGRWFKAGKCPPGQNGTHSDGGYGGGGASCGPGGGGGAGYYGGLGGQNSPGMGGSNGATIPFSSVPGVNRGDGYVLIYACRLKCPLGSICRFIHWQTNATMKCCCTNGLELDAYGNCTLAIKTEKFSRVVYIYSTLLVTIAAFIGLGGLLFGIFCFCHQRRVLQKSQRRTADAFYLHERLALNSLTSTYDQSAINHAVNGNPIYEPVGLFAELTKIPRNYVMLIKAIGQGAFGEVYEGILTIAKDNGHGDNRSQQAVAVKTLPEIATQQALSDFEMEAIIMSKFKHENIVRFIGICFEQLPRYIVLELLGGGDLKTFLRESRPKSRSPSANITDSLRMVDLLEMALDVAKGCRYLEENRFIHRDIAARNCLLTSRGIGRMVKIADFGMARDIYRADYYRKGGKAMLPVRWMPPEAFLDGIFTSKTDVWSFGVLMWEVFSMGYMPYPGRNNLEVMQLVTAGSRLEAPNGTPFQVHLLMSDLWQTIADERPSFDLDPELRAQPLPPMVYRLMHPSSAMNSLSSPLTTPVSELPIMMTTSLMEGRQHPTFSESSRPRTSMSQSTMTTTVGSLNGSASYISVVPNRGIGVTPGVCPPYHSHSNEPACHSLMEMQKTSLSSASSSLRDLLTAVDDPADDCVFRPSTSSLNQPAFPLFPKGPKSRKPIILDDTAAADAFIGTGIAAAPKQRPSSLYSGNTATAFVPTSYEMGTRNAIGDQRIRLLSDQQESQFV